MRKDQILFAGAVFLAIVSCTVERAEESPVIGFVLDASIEGYEDAGTKTVIGETDLGNALVLCWEAGEQIGIYGDGIENVALTGTNAEVSGKTTFATTETLASVPTCAYYPYNAEFGHDPSAEDNTAADPSALTFSIGDTQFYSGPESLAAYDIKTASGFTRQDDGTYKAVFSQKACVLKIDIDLSGVEEISSNEAVTAVGISSMSETTCLTGEFTLDITDSDAGLQPGEYGVSSVYVAFDETLGISAGSKATVFAVVAPGVARGEELYFSIDTDSHYIEFAALSKCNFTAGRYYTLTLNSTTIGAGWHYVEDESDPESKGIRVEGPVIIDISEEE
ncbi:MAG: hypothetical protein ACI3Z0_10905 [Candidatus Cryptobacteroides sp.]